MKAKLHAFVRLVRKHLRPYSALVIVFLVVLLTPAMTACAAVQPALPGAGMADTVKVVNFTVSQVRNVIDNPTVYDLTSYARPDKLCPTCWLSWSANGQRYFAMIQQTGSAIDLWPRGLQATGPVTAREIEANITNSGWTAMGRYVVFGLAMVTRNPGLLSIDLVDFDPGKLPWDLQQLFRQVAPEIQS